MDLPVWLFEQPQLINQFCLVPFALLFYSLAKLRYLTLTERYLYLTLGGCVLAVVTMGPYSLLLFVPALCSWVLACLLHPQDLHPWALGLQMSWQTFWHLHIQYNEYWLLEPSDTRLLLTVSALMLLTQRVTSAALDLHEGKATPWMTGPGVPSRVSAALPYLSYTLYFPGLLGGPLCSFAQFMHFVERSATSPPPSPLRAVLSKALAALALQWLRRPLAGLLESRSLALVHLGAPGEVLWLWALSVLLRLTYYAHWAASDCLCNAAGLGFSGWGRRGCAMWDGLCDGRPWEAETCFRLSAFTRSWNRTTAAWLRRLVYQRCRTAPLALTFAFSAWWHGLHPGQLVGFTLWGTTVWADHALHRRLYPRLASRAQKLAYECLSWVVTQLVIACIMVAVELRSVSSLWLLWRTRVCLLPLLYVLLLLFL